MTRRRWFWFLLLNVLVSATVTGLILFFYDRSLRVDCLPAAPVPTPAASPVTADLDILSVVGAGTVSSEIVVIRNNGAESLLLTGWTLRDGEGSIFTFPLFSLPAGATVRIHTAAGTDSASDLYWGRSAPVWQAGEPSALYDPGGTARAFYRVP
ncbi:MAG: hypothetical protein FD146_2236 [Anaerolineaceae bacterium]|nr:MAG: hypothetical protein FD146_2236 [Anaerolineaceae bacterium]